MQNNRFGLYHNRKSSNVLRSSSIKPMFVKTEEDLIYRIQKFMRCKITVNKCSNYIDHLRTVIPIIIERRGD